ncbi:hypothetical protein [Streptomyces sp. NPDC095614]|uniref:hypothetical protein n=1 Tax=Streptomyces sp. NPDC095614 TaxID=3156692 RepID=UPI00332BE57D
MQDEVDGGERNGLTSGEREELTALRRENRLRKDVDVLKRATAFFAKETRWRCTRSSKRRSVQVTASNGRVS